MKRAFSMVVFSAVISFISLTGANSGAFDLSRTSDTILIVPARPAVLQLAFDLEKMRSLTLVSFRGKVGAAEPLIHVWTGNDWQYVSFDDFCSLRFAARPPRTAIIIGDDQTVPRALLQGPAWPCKIERLPTMNIADLVNGLNPYFQFSSREWKRLADSYGLKLEDVNASKRDFNPYNIPRSKMPLKTHDFKQEKGDTPPAVLIEKQDSPPAKQPEKTPEKPWIK